MKLVFAFLLFAVQCSFAQVAVTNRDKFDDIKKGTLYVYAGDQHTARGTQMAAAIKSAWTVSRLEFLATNNIPENLRVPGNFFVTEDHSSTSFQYMRDPARGTGEVTFSEVSTNDYYYLNFWYISSGYAAGKNLEKHKNTFARAELFYRKMGQAPEMAMEISDEPGFLGSYLNGTPAQVKNMFQIVNNSIRDNETRQLKEDMHTSAGLSNLKADTLYVPNIWYGPGGTQMSEENKFYAKYGSKMIKILDNMLAEYKHPIKLIRRDELNTMLLTTTKPVYYFNYVQSSADKMVSVINGLTGEVIYYNFARKSYRPKEKDFGDLSDAVNDAK
jgi:hypothetical protein